MTMKTKKTLQHIAAVAVVLLALCLVFAAPVSADAVATVVSSDGTETTVENLAAAFSSDNSIIFLLNDVVVEETITITHTNVTLIGNGKTISPAANFPNTSNDDFILEVTGDDFTMHNVIIDDSARTIHNTTDGGVCAIATVCIYGENAVIDTNTIKAGTSEKHRSTAILVFAHANNTIIHNNTIELGKSNRINNASLMAEKQRDESIGIRIKPEDTTHPREEAGPLEYLIIQNNTINQKNGVSNPQIGIMIDEAEVGNEIMIFGNIFNLDNNGAIIEVMTSDERDPSLGLAFLDNKGKANTFLSLIVDDWDDTNGFNQTLYGIVHFSSDMSCGKFLDLKNNGDFTIGQYTQTNVADAADYTECTAALEYNEPGYGKLTVFYDTLDEAIDSSNAGDTIVLLQNNDLETGLVIDHSLTIKSAEGKKYAIANGGSAANLEDRSGLIINGASSVNIENIILNAQYALRIKSPSVITVSNSEINGWAAVYFKDGSDASTLTVTGSVLNGTSTVDGDTDDFGTIVFENNDTVVNIIDSTVKATAAGAAEEALFLINDYHTVVPVQNNKVTVTSGHLILSKTGTGNATFVYDNTSIVENTGNSVIIKSGVTSTSQIPAKFLEGGYECVGSGSSWKVQLAPAPELSYASSAKDDKEDEEEPEQPEEPVEPTPETPAAPGEVVSSTEVTDGGDVTFETPAAEDGTAPAAADEEIKGVVLPEGTAGTVEFVPVSEQPAPAGKEEQTKRVFEINVPSYEKGKASVVKFQMTVDELTADGKTAADVALWHFDEETGEWTKLVTTFTIVDGVVYFEAITNDFSPFAIIYDDAPAEEPTEPETPEQPEEPASPAPVFAVLAGLGAAAVVLRRK